MTHPDLAVVTGAFSYTGSYVARRLLKQGGPRKDPDAPPGPAQPLRPRSGSSPLDFSDPEGSIQGRLTPSLY